MLIMLKLLHKNVSEKRPEWIKSVCYVRLSIGSNDEEFNVLYWIWELATNLRQVVVNPYQKYGV